MPDSDQQRLCQPQQQQCGTYLHVPSTRKPLAARCAGSGDGGQVLPAPCTSTHMLPGGSSSSGSI